MKEAPIIMRGLAWIIIAILFIPSGMAAQVSGQPGQTDRFSEEELVQMLAPIALYPDPLIAQILMASTYPLELVEAERWMRQNKKLQGADLDAALQEKSWDPSVGSLCHFPDLLFAMSDKLDQTRKLGDAFLDQPDDVMATIQELRRTAEEQGNLGTTSQQIVDDEEDAIRIEPSDPQIVYVPVYDPLFVYGPWWYPAYPPYYWYYPADVFISDGYISFDYGFSVGIGIASWCWFDWHNHSIHTDIHKTRRFHRFDRRRDISLPVWRHDPIHRRGVAYRDRTTSERFRSMPSPVSPVSPETRGYPARDIQQKAVQPSQTPAVRPERLPAPRVKTDGGTMQPVPERDTPFSGIGNGSFERRASERGGVSRQGEGAVRQGKGTERQGLDAGRQSKGGSKGTASGEGGKAKEFRR